MSTLKRLLVPALLAAASFAMCLVAIVSPAPAADKGGPPSRAEAEAMFPVSPWTAIYGGVGVGTFALTDDFGSGLDGYFYGGRIGADVQVNRLVFGVLADYNWDHTSTGGSSATAKEWGVMGRAGVLVTDSTLLYGVAGPKWLSVSGSDTKGLGVGGGLEVALTKHWRMGVEYQHITWDDIPAAREQTMTGRLIFAFPVAGLR